MQIIVKAAKVCFSSRRGARIRYTWAPFVVSHGARFENGVKHKQKPPLHHPPDAVPRKYATIPRPARVRIKLLKKHVTFDDVHTAPVTTCSFLTFWHHFYFLGACSGLPRECKSRVKYITWAPMGRAVPSKPLCFCVLHTFPNVEPPSACKNNDFHCVL